jgi:lysophospholipase L1-like esterase
MGYDTSVQTLGRLSSHVLPLRPEVVLLQVGINDLKYMALTGRSVESIVAEVTRNIRRIVGRLRQHGSLVILTTIFPVCFKRWQETAHDPQQMAAGVSVANQSLCHLAGSEGLYLFDAATYLTEGTAVPSRWAIDGLHINQAGYQQLNRQLQAMATRFLS